LGPQNCTICRGTFTFECAKPNVLQIARQHAHFILALYALVDYVIVLVQPLVIAWAAASKDKAELATQVLGESMGFDKSYWNLHF
jgi:hypothetical protein